MIFLTILKLFISINASIFQHSIFSFLCIVTLYIGLTFRNMKSGMKNPSLELFPDLVLKNILKFLCARDIFELGQCSRRLNRIVVDETNHPLTTELQSIKTLFKHYFKKTTVYDEIERFRFIDKCEKD